MSQVTLADRDFSDCPKYNSSRCKGCILRSNISFINFSDIVSLNDKPTTSSFFPDLTRCIKVCQSTII